MWKFPWPHNAKIYGLCFLSLSTPKKYGFRVPQSNDPQIHVFYSALKFLTGADTCFNANISMTAVFKKQFTLVKSACRHVLWFKGHFKTNKIIKHPVKCAPSSPSSAIRTHIRTLVILHSFREQKSLCTNQFRA